MLSLSITVYYVLLSVSITESCRSLTRLFLLLILNEDTAGFQVTWADAITTRCLMRWQLQADTRDQYHPDFNPVASTDLGQHGAFT